MRHIVVASNEQHIVVTSNEITRPVWRGTVHDGMLVVCSCRGAGHCYSTGLCEACHCAEGLRGVITRCIPSSKLGGLLQYVLAQAGRGCLCTQRHKSKRSTQQHIGTVQYSTRFQRHMQQQTALD